MPYERKKVETFTIDARNRITSELQINVNGKWNRKGVVQQDLIQTMADIDKHSTLCRKDASTRPAI